VGIKRKNFAAIAQSFTLYLFIMVVLWEPSRLCVLVAKEQEVAASQYHQDL